MKNKPPETPLIDAVKDNNLAKVVTLLLSGHPVDEQDDYASTPLLWACQHNRSAIAMVLLSYGADAKRRNDGQRDMVYYCAVGGAIDIVKQVLPLLSKDALTQEYPDLNTPLSLCLRNSQKTFAQFLLNEHPPNDISESALTRLFVTASQSPLYHLLPQLTHLPAFRSLSDHKRQALLDHALSVTASSRKSFRGSILTLINLKANPLNQEVIPSALMNGCAQKAILCCNYIEDLSSVRVGEEPLLLLAIRHNSEAFLSHLLKRKVNIDQTIFEGQNALELGFRYKISPRLLDYLLEQKSTSQHNLLGLAAHHQAWELFSHLLATQPINVPDGTTSPLATLIKLGADYHQLVRMIQHGANIHAIDADGMSIIHLAAKFGHGQFIRLLVDSYGVAYNVVSRNEARQTPLDVAEQHQQEATVELLRAMGPAHNIDLVKCPEPIYLLGFYDPTSTADIPVETDYETLAAAFHVANRDANGRLIQHFDRHLQTTHQQIEQERETQQQETQQMLNSMRQQILQLERRLQASQTTDDDQDNNNSHNKKTKS